MKRRLKILIWEESCKFFLESHRLTDQRQRKTIRQDARLSYNEALKSSELGTNYFRSPTCARTFQSSISSQTWMTHRSSSRQPPRSSLSSLITVSLRQKVRKESKQSCGPQTWIRSYSVTIQRLSQKKNASVILKNMTQILKPMSISSMRSKCSSLIYLGCLETVKTSQTW